MDKRVSYKISVYNFILAIIIVLCHVGFGGALEPKNDWDRSFYEFWPAFYMQLGTTALRLYMMISAFLLYYNANGKNIRKKIISRGKSLILPYIVWNVIYAVYLATIEKQDIWKWDTLKEGFFGDPFDGPLWFMLTLIAFLPLAPVFGRLTKWWQALLGVAVIWTIRHFLPVYSIPIVNWFVAHCETNSAGVAYFAGFLLARICPNVILKERYQRKALFSVVGLAILGIVYASNLNLISIPIFVGRPVYVYRAMEIVGACAFWLLLPADFIGRFRKDWENVHFPLTTSFFIYAGHIIVARLVIRYIMAPIVYSRGTFDGLRATAITLVTQILVIVVLLVGIYILQIVLPLSLIHI